MEMKILIIEDKEVDIKTGEMGVSIDIAQNLEDGLKKLHENEYFHVITDLDFPPEKKDEVDFEKIVLQYSAFLSRIIEKRSEEHTSELQSH